MSASKFQRKFMKKQPDRVCIWITMAVTDKICFYKRWESWFVEPKPGGMCNGKATKMEGLNLTSSHYWSLQHMIVLAAREKNSSLWLTGTNKLPALFTMLISMEFIHSVNEEMVKLVKEIESDKKLEYVNYIIMIACWYYSSILLQSNHTRSNTTR